MPRKRGEFYGGYNENYKNIGKNSSGIYSLSRRY